MTKGRIIATSPGWRALAGHGGRWVLQAEKRERRRRCWLTVAQGDDRSGLAAGRRKLTGKEMAEKGATE